MANNTIDISRLPAELQERVFEILGKNHIPTKSVTLEQILPELDVTQEQREQLIKVLSPESKRDVNNHARLESILSKYKGKAPNPKLQVIKDELQKRKRGN